MSTADRPAPRGGPLRPEVTWTVATDAPLRGFRLAREAVRLFAWDEANNLYLFDQLGRRTWASRAEGRVRHAAISDDGDLIAVLVDPRRIWLLDAELELQADRETPPDPVSVAVDPHGRFAVVTSQGTRSQIFNRHGKPVGQIETLQPLAHAAFIPDRPILIGAAGHGSLFAIELSGSSSRLDSELLWRQSLLSTVGRVEVTGDGGMILATCFVHGLQRFDAEGRSEGAYHLGGTAMMAVPDFLGRSIAAATQEGELVLLNRAGNVRWKTDLPRPATALEIDALGRFLFYGLGTGEITRLDLDGSARPAVDAPAPAASRTATSPTGARPAAANPGGIREPAWSQVVAKTDDQAETAVLAVLDRPTRLALITNTNRLQVLDPKGEKIHEAEPLMGVGRILRTAPGWIAAATDRQVLVYNAGENLSNRLDLNLVEVTHLILRPERHGLAVVQERDRVGRATLQGRWMWREELDSPVEDLAVGPETRTAVTTEDGQLRLFDPAGNRLPCRAPTAQEPLMLCANSDPGAPGVAWITLARQQQVLRGHDLDGNIAWELPVPWVSWLLQDVGPSILVTAPDGRALVVDGNGRTLARGNAETPPGIYGPAPDGGSVAHLTLDGPHLTLTAVGGPILWRALASPGRRPLALGRSGAATIDRRSLLWFPST